MSAWLLLPVPVKKTCLTTELEGHRRAHRTSRPGRRLTQPAVGHTRLASAGPSRDCVLLLLGQPRALQPHAATSTRHACQRPAAAAKARPGLFTLPGWPRQPVTPAAAAGPKAFMPATLAQQAGRRIRWLLRLRLATGMNPPRQAQACRQQHVLRQHLFFSAARCHRLQ